MDESLTAAVAGIVGLLVGAVGVLASRWSERAPASPAVVDEELPSGIADVLAVLPSAAVVVDVADTVVKASPAAYAFGLVRDGYLVHSELEEVVGKVRRDGEIREGDMVLPRGPLGADGAGTGVLVVGVRVAPLGSLHVLVLLEDRTEARRLEEVRRDFVANVSHELKTPVGAVALLAETMEDAAEDPVTVRRFAGRMRREAVRLSALVQEIVQLSRLQDTDARHQPVVVDVEDAVLEAVDRTRMAAEDRGVRISTFLGRERGTGGGDPVEEPEAPGPTAPAGPFEVWGDRDLVVTAVRNLVDNAVVYSEPGTRVSVVVALVEGRVEVAVSDQGIGIPGHELDRIFERFYRVDPARSRSTGGTGLGLSIVKHVAANHGGDVVVWSSEGEGSTFTLRLPRRVTASDVEDVPPQAVAPRHLVRTTGPLPAPPGVPEDAPTSTPSTPSTPSAPGTPSTPSAPGPTRRAP